MPRPRKLDRPSPLQINLPESLKARLTMLLYSPAEGRVPQGAWSTFFVTLAEQALSRLPAPTEGANDGHVS